MFGKYQHITKMQIFGYNKVLGVVKTKAEAQAIVDAEVQAAQAAWDVLSAEEQAMRNRPADITLVE
jgi:alpha-D-ribose 1-methylphosphonate 5-triphosphate synthase subunit PhnG